MTNEEMIAQAERELKSRADYRYNPVVLEETIKAGELAEGTAFLTNSDGSKVTYFRDAIKLIKNGEVIKTMPWSEKARDMAIISNAKTTACRAVTTARHVVI